MIVLSESETEEPDDDIFVTPPQKKHKLHIGTVPTTDHRTRADVTAIFRM